MRKIIISCFLIASLSGCQAMGAGLVINGAANLTQAVISSRDFVNVLKGLKSVADATSQICYASLPELQETALSAPSNSKLAIIDSYALAFCLDLSTSGTPATTDKNSAKWLTMTVAQQHVLNGAK
jgi:hypothetical protein